MGLVDFAAWVSDHLVVENKAGNEWTCHCPVCGKPKLAVNVKKEAYQCWLCKFSGRRPTGLVRAVMGLTTAQAEAHLATNSLMRAQTKIKPLNPKKPDTWRRRLPKAPLPPGTQPLQGRALKYADQRGISRENAAIFGLSSILGDGKRTQANRLLAGRLLIPVFDLWGRLVYWVARATDGHKIKTINLPNSDRHEEWGLPLVSDCATRSEVLVGLNAVPKGSRVIVVEGPMDVAVCGIGFVATMGASMSRQQAALLAESGASEAVILYDPDDAGRKGADQAYDRLSPFLRTRIARCPCGTDPADLGRSEALRIVNSEEGGLPDLEHRQARTQLEELRWKSGWIRGLKK